MITVFALVFLAGAAFAIVCRLACSIFVLDRELRELMRAEEDELNARDEWHNRNHTGAA